MESIKRADHNTVYKGDEDRGGSVRDLSITRFEPGHVAGDWRFDDEDRMMIAGGATIRLHYYTEPIPPVAFELVAPECFVHDGVEMGWLGAEHGFVCPNCGADQNGTKQVGS